MIFFELDSSMDSVITLLVISDISGVNTA